MHIIDIIYKCLMNSYAAGELSIYPWWMIWHEVWCNNDTYMYIPGFRFMAALLHCILAIHIYWYVIMAKIGFKFFTKGKLTDR